MKFNVVQDGQPYQLLLRWARSIRPSDPEFKDFSSIVYKELMKVMLFERLGRSMFNPKRAQIVNNLEVWPGFYSAVQKMEIGAVICIDLVSKVIRKDKMLGFIRALNDSGKSRDQIQEECARKCVVTSYGNNKHTYEI